MKKTKVYKFKDQEIELPSKTVAKCTVTGKEVNYITATLAGLIARSYNNSWSDFKANYKCREGARILKERAQPTKADVNEEEVEKVKKDKPENFEPYRIYILRYYKSIVNGLTKAPLSKLGELKDIYNNRFPTNDFKSDLVNI